MQWSWHTKSGAFLQYLPAHPCNLVFIAHLEYCVQTGRYWSALHTYYGVCSTLDVGVLTAHYSPDCASDTTADTACAHQVFALCNALKRHNQIHAMIQATND